MFTLKNNLKAMIKEANSRPGVAEVMEVYSTYSQIMKSAQPYFMVNKKPSFSITDSKTQ